MELYFESHRDWIFGEYLKLKSQKPAQLLQESINRILAEQHKQKAMRSISNFTLGVVVAHYKKVVVCLSVCLSACLPVCLSACLPACLPACRRQKSPNFVYQIQIISTYFACGLPASNAVFIYLIDIHFFLISKTR